MTKHLHLVEPPEDRRFGIVVGILGGVVWLVAAFALIRLAIAVEDAAAYSRSAATPSEMTVTYAGLEAPLATQHPGMRAPRRMCIVALDDGGATHAARLDGRACAGLRQGDRASVLVWRGRVVAIDGWATGDQPQGELVAWVAATAALGVAGVILTGVSIRANRSRRPAWYYDHLER